MPPSNGNDAAHDTLLDRLDRLINAVETTRETARVGVNAALTNDQNLNRLIPIIERQGRGIYDVVGAMDTVQREYVQLARQHHDESIRTERRQAAAAIKIHRNATRELRAITASLAVIVNDVDDAKRAAQGGHKPPPEGQLTALAKLVLGPKPTNARLILVGLLLALVGALSGGKATAWFQAHVEGDTMKETVQIETHRPRQELPPHQEPPK
jgi:hypothetical protein